MKESKTTGMICVRDSLDFEYHVSKIEYIEREDESYSYLFTPNYSVIDLLPTSIFQGIPGLNLELRKEQYRRDNMVPVFISERTPGENREDLWELLDACGMTYLNRLEWLIRTDLQYSGDPLYVKRFEEGDEKHTVSFEQFELRETRSVRMLEDVLVEICRGNDVGARHFQIDDSNRLQTYYLLMALYQKEKGYLEARKREGIRQSARAGAYKGRKPIALDPFKAEEVFAAFRAGKLSEAEAIQKLGVSRSTFYRRLKKSLQSP